MPKLRQGLQFNAGGGLTGSNHSLLVAGGAFQRNDEVYMVDVIARTTAGMS